ncbi:hypothetical protein [Candidatus Chloroploca sp. Khr17]|uniref:hypothetical protein n=1 Tax=Candidatus Chloroploca sp. Khr17 TaxID=2496869 RepID=UPI00101CDF7D|nr:hypothetical protein [Candidatus Chloroploca sp. Khr17]
MAYRLLTEFENLFAGNVYRHRDSSLGDFVAMQLYEDLVSLNRSTKLSERVASHDWILNTANKRQGIRARRGDGTFGEIVPGEKPIVDPGYQVARGKVATVEIGAEVKILAKAMIKQIDRVIGDLQKQVTEFKRGGGSSSPICIGIVGLNHASVYTSFEGTRSFKTDGRGTYRHPFQEAPEAERRLLQLAAPYYDEFIILHFEASNESPFPFSWVNLTLTSQNYGSALLRISREYDRRF